MKGALVLGTVLLGVAIQAALARYTVAGNWVFDFVLVAVVAAGLQWGPVAGLFAGTLGGLLQDALSGEVVGVGGLIKTLVGFAAGVVGAQFVMTQSLGKALVVALATPVHRFAVIAVTALIDQQWPGVSWNAMLAEVVINTLVAFAVFQGVVSVPGAIERRRANRRSSFSRRRWS